jgi:hypothetical protein
MVVDGLDKAFDTRIWAIGGIWQAWRDGIV